MLCIIICIFVNSGQRRTLPRNKITLHYHGGHLKILQNDISSGIVSQIELKRWEAS